MKNTWLSTGFAASSRLFAAGVVQEHEIEVRCIAELVAAQLPVSDGADLHGAPHRTRAVRIEEVRHSELRSDLRPREAHRLLDDDLGDLGEIVADAHERDRA
jgi:hypothetical protein